MSTPVRRAEDEGRKAIPEPLPSGGHGVELIDHEEIEAVTTVLRSKALFRFGHGEQCAGFEREVQELLGIRHALFVNSGTSALSCGLAGLGIGPGDEVIVPAYTYIATAAAVLEVGAVPVIAEIDASLGLDPEDVRARITPSTKALLPVHMQGVPCRLDALCEIARTKGLHVLEDCCQAVGASYRGKPVGTHGQAGAWSLNYFKTITCGEGGVLFTDDDNLFERALFQHDPALPMWLKGRPTWGAPPFSRGGYRGNELNAAVARVQLRKLALVQTHCRGLKRLLLSLLDPQPRCYVRQHVEDPEGDNGISFAMIVRSQALAGRFSEALTAEGLPIGGAYSPAIPDRHMAMNWDSIVHQNGATAAGYPWKDPAYKGHVAYSKDAWPKTADLLARTLRLSIHMKLTDEHIRQVADAINKVDATLG